MAVNYRDPNVLRRHIRRIIDFYHPACIDSERGGYINQFTDDGTIYDRDTKHLVGTCRFIFNYAVAAELFGGGEYRSAAAHGVAFLQSAHRQSDGGFAWVLGPRGVEDGTRHCYGHAFVLLAAALAARAGVSEADTLTGEVYELLEERFWDPGARLYVDEIAAGNWREISPYRGQNANMHLCEAMLAAFETSREDRYLDRALTLAKRICVELAAPARGLIWEHYTTDWQHDWEYNRDDAKNLFRPYGYLPGHFVEWAKLLLILERHRAEPWLAPAAARLFDTALQRSWDQEQGGMHYAFAPDGTILDTDRYYWVLAETVAAAALLAVRTGEARYWDWYDRAWHYADRHFVDHAHGAWYRVLDRDGHRYDDQEEPAEQDRLPPARRLLRDSARPAPPRPIKTAPPRRHGGHSVRGAAPPAAVPAVGLAGPPPPRLPGQVGHARAESLQALQRRDAARRGIQQLRQRGNLHHACGRTQLGGQFAVVRRARRLLAGGFQRCFRGGVVHAGYGGQEADQFRILALGAGTADGDVGHRGGPHRQPPRHIGARFCIQTPRHRLLHPLYQRRAGAPCRGAGEIPETDADIGLLGVLFRLPGRRIRLPSAPVQHRLRVPEQPLLHLGRLAIGGQQRLQPLQGELLPRAAPRELGQCHQQVVPVRARHRLTEVALHRLQLARGQPRRQLVEEALDHVHLVLIDRRIDPRGGAEYSGQGKVERLPVVGPLAPPAAAAR